MKLIPLPKTVTPHDGVCDFSKVTLGGLPVGLPAGAVTDLKALVSDEDGGVLLSVTCQEDALSERYTLSVETDAVSIAADGPRGVFYAVQTLKQLLREGTVLPCVTIEDEPDLCYRGLYQDVSRGRIPTLDTLMRLVDRLSEWKMNSLQLYVEHTHRFAEYAGINDDLGFYTDDDIRTLDRYCRERCVELIPSLSSFGHLYYLLQSKPYHHLCEMEQYEPTVHNWHERLLHHTIDPSNPESLSLITSLIAQYEPLFSSKCFNICCDETFDLCKGRNAGGDVASTYVGFVTKLAEFLRARGKTVMMWGDIVMQHPQAFETLPEDIVFLNWCYDMSASGLNAERFREHSRPQIVCPSVHSHKRFMEKIEYSVPNIQKVARLGFENGAVGLLTTNWGDYGHVCFDETMLYGLAFSAAMSWNVYGTNPESFDKAVSSLLYRDESGEVLAILRTLNRCDELFLDSFGYEKALWELTVQYFDNENGTPRDFDRHKADLQKLDLTASRKICLDCAARLQALSKADRLDPVISEAMQLAARGMAVIFGVLDAACHDREYDKVLTEELSVWLADYHALWLKRNQCGEWAAIEEFFTVNIYRR